jgi:hypothetical protein
VAEVEIDDRGADVGAALFDYVVPEDCADHELYQPEGLRPISVFYRSSTGTYATGR